MPCICSLIGLTPSKSVIESLQSANAQEEEDKAKATPLVVAPAEIPNFSSMFNAQELIGMFDVVALLS